MYNPHNLHECEEEKKKNPRKLVDGVMTAVGGIAAISSLPQVFKIWNTGSVTDISLATQLIALIAVICWFSYGLYIRNKPLIITSGLSTIVLAVVVMQIFTLQ